MMWALVFLGAVIVGLMFLTWKLVWKPNLPIKKGPYVDNATSRGRTIILDKDNFGTAEVLEGKRLPDNRALFKMRDKEGVTHQVSYFLHHLLPYDTFSCVCGQGAPVFIVKRTYAKLEGISTEEIDKFRESERGRRDAISESKRSKVEVTEKSRERIDDMIKLEQAKEKGYTGK